MAKIKEQIINKNLTVVGDLTVIGEINRGELTYLKNTKKAAGHSIAGGDVTGGTTVPTTPVISVCKPVSVKAILITWDRQRNLTDLDRYEVQVSADDANWYSLEFDGTDWKDTIAEDTDWEIETLIHNDIPLGGTTEDPVGVLLYYRVRRVTKAPAVSAWSASASATTKAVAAGDLAANCVYANNIVAGTITADKIDTTDLDVHKLTVTDDLDRYIEISADKGLYAEDEDGNVIHDIPDAPILAGMAYGGHVIFIDSSTYIDTGSADYTGILTSNEISTGLRNADITAFTAGLTNVKGAIVFAYYIVSAQAAKMAAETQIGFWASYSSVYNTAPGDWNFMMMDLEQSRVATQAYYSQHGRQVLVPVTHNGGSSYITWNAYLHFTAAVNANASINSDIWIFLQGLLV